MFFLACGWGGGEGGAERGAVHVASRRQPLINADSACLSVTAATQPAPSLLSSFSSLLLFSHILLHLFLFFSLFLSFLFFFIREQN